MTRLLPIFVIAGAGLVLTLPTLIYGYPAYGHDSLNHLIRYLHFSAQLWDGELYPRWLSGMNLGLGAPAMFFYPPVAYYATSLLRPLLGSDPFGWYQLAVAATLALIASGAAAYLWLATMVGRRAAVIGAVFYMALPYHLAADLYVRGAFAEYWSFVWMPLVLWQIGEIARGRRLAILWLTLAYALLVMTHPLTTLVFSPLALCYALVVTPFGPRMKVVLVVALGMALGVGLSAIYLLPALLTQDSVHVSDVSASAANYFERRFLFQEPSLSPNPTWNLILTHIVVVTAALAGLAVAICCLCRNVGAEVRFWAAVAVTAVFMMTSLSKPVWVLIPVLQRLHFPWRLSTLLTLATALLVAYAAASVRRPLSAGVKVAAALGLVLMAASLAMTAYLALVMTEADKSAQSRFVATGTAHKVFWPKSAFIHRPDLKEKLLADHWGLPFGFELPFLEKFGNHAPRAVVLGGEGTWEISRWSPRDIAAQVSTSEGVTLMIGQFFYPGWRAGIVGRPCCLPLGPSPPDGLIKIEVPPGDHLIQLRLRPGPEERVGSAISAASALVTLILALWIWLGRRPSSERRSFGTPRA